MSLPTPPKSSHREEKENRTQASGCRVVWSQHNQYHSLSAPPRGPTFCSATKEPPAKSILKKSSFPLLPLENECEQREFTPEPSNPLGDPTYLNTPIITIISDSDHKLSELIQAYSVLAARLRAYVHERTDGSCTIFTPLKKSREFVLKSILRDLGRALVNPVVSEERDSARVVTLLPSPTNSPKKKRGMTAEQAKLARDLCTLSHSVLKLIGLVFTLRVVYQIFSDAELGQILTAVLAIPLADALPTPNARKTCALAICVIQTQRLPSSVLLGAKDRIAYALRRGIDGELGKEGKRGSASDGLKAVHDLAIYQPETFIPAFSQLIDSVLNNLLGPSLALRINACHALGGLAIASAETPLSQNHVRIASAIASFLLTIPTKTSPTKSTPSSKSNLAESPICRTLRTTLNNESPSHVAQGPVWALSVLASFSVLLGSSLFKDSRLSRAITSLLSIPLRHKKSSIRCLACIVWRSLTWAHFQPAYSDPDGESEGEGEDHKSQNQSCHTAANNWKILQAVLTMGTGTSILAACVGSGPETDDEGLRRVIQLLELMIRKNPDTLKDAMQVIIQLLSLSPSKRQWDMNNLLPRSLFSGVPGLLTTDFSQLQPIVRQAYDACTSADDVRPLTCDELSRHGILDEFFHLWQRAAYLHDVFEKDLDLVKEGWIALLNAAMAIYEDGTEESSEVVAQKVAHTIQQLLSGDITYGSPNSSVELPTSKFDPQSAFARMLKLLQELWSIARNTLPCDNLDRHADSLLRCLVKYEEEMNVDEKSSRGEWAAFCVELSLACGGVDAFWSDTAATKWDWSVEIRSRVWSIFVRRVQADRRGAWDDALLLLSLPFRDPNAWDLSGEDLDTWEGLLRFGLEKARDIGFDDLTALNEVAENLHQPTFSSCGRIAEMLLTRCQLSEGDAFPSVLVEFITDTLRSRYPPKPSEVTSSLWIMRPLREMIETCPKSLTQSLLEILQEGISLWVSDEYEVMAELDYGEVVNLYESSLRSIPESLEAYEALAPLLEAVFLGRPDKPSALEAFENFWNDSSYSSIVDSNDWPAKIQEHFGAATQEVPEALDLPPSSPPSSDDGLEAESTPNIDILSLLPAPVILSTPPKHTRTSSTAPPCLNQTPTYYSPVFTPTPSIPSTHATPRDAMALVRSPLLISPRVKRRRTENKENESPNVLLGHTRPVFASPPQKRRLSKENDDDRPLKRVRIDTATLSSIPKLKLSVEPTKACDDEEAVEEMLIPRDSISPRKDVFGVPLQRTNSRKRKAIILDAVEIFTFQEFERRRTSPRKPVKASSQTALPRTPRTPQRKAIDMSSSPTIPDVLDLNSDDSIMLGRSSPVKDPKQSSSDDDPHLGQVTPHHLISPILKRAKRSYDEDPPSDDSITLGSPSKAVVLRRMQRLGSATGRIA